MQSAQAYKDNYIKTFAKNRYSSTILKFKQQRAIKTNMILSVITDNQLPAAKSLDRLAMFSQSSPMLTNGSSLQKIDKQPKIEEVFISPEGEQNRQALMNLHMAGLIASDTSSSINSSAAAPEDLVKMPSQHLSSMGSELILPSGEKFTQDFYTTSVMELSKVRVAQELVDQDLKTILKFIGKLTPSTDEELKERYVTLGEMDRQKTLIFDMDETLIHAFPTKLVEQQPSLASLADFSVKMKNGEEFYVSVRPFIFQLLDSVEKLYELVIFTAGEQEYADLIIDVLEREKKYFKKRLYRQHCSYRPGYQDVFVKDLRIIQDRELEEMAIVDNSMISFSFQITNGIPICPYFSGNNYD